MYIIEPINNRERTEMDYQAHLARNEAKALTFVSNISSVIAAKAGKGYKVIAEMKDGSEIVIKKGGNLKSFVNIFDFDCNGNAQGADYAKFCAFNNKAGVKQIGNGGKWNSPIASFQITVAA